MSRLPERDRRAAASKGGRFGWRPSNAVVAVIFILIIIIGPYLAFTKHVPFTSYGYEVKATFANSANIATNSPVRVAGVNVGKVISTERDGNATTVTFTVEDGGRPVHDDAFAAIRPRIFLEGNFFIELDPGSPSAPELDSGGTIPVSHTSTAVQIDEVFSALQSPVRADLGRFLQGFGTALAGEPTAAEDLTQLPEVRGKTGAEALNGALKYGGESGRYGAQLSDALTGTNQGDLAKVVSSTGRAAAALDSSEADLKGFIDNFNTVTGALAAQSANLTTTVHLLAPTLRVAHSSLVSLNRTLPPLRTFAIELRPAVAELPDLISSSKPFLAQVRPLLSGKELGGVAKLLSEGTPGLAGAAQASKETTLPQLNQVSLCGSKVMVPTANEVIEDQFHVNEPNYREFLYSLVDIAGQAQNFDGNGPYARIQAGGGGKIVEERNAGEVEVLSDQVNYASTAVAPQGTQPQPGKLPPFKTSVRCYTQPIPDLNAGLGEVGPPSPSLVK